MKTTTLPLHNFPEEAPQDSSVLSLKHPDIKAKKKRMKIADSSPIKAGQTLDAQKPWQTHDAVNRITNYARML